MKHRFIRSLMGIIALLGGCLSLYMGCIATTKQGILLFYMLYIIAWVAAFGFFAKD